MVSPLAPSSLREAAPLNFGAALDALLEELRSWQAELRQDLKRARERNLRALAVDLARLQDHVDRVLRAGEALHRSW